MEEKARGRSLKQQENIEAVVQEANVDLIEGPQDYEDVHGPMSEEFFDRFEHYSATADTDELRQRWGRVLAAEIRRPGTFSAKVLRVIDELDSGTAQVFERICRFRVGKALYRPLMDKLSFRDTIDLVGASLLVEPGIVDKHTVFGHGRGPDGQEVWLGGSDKLVFVLPKGGINQDAFNRLLVNNGEQIGVRAHVLTDVGEAISSILPDNSQAVIRAMASRLAEHIEGGKVALLRPMPTGELVTCGYAEPSDHHDL